MNWDIVQTIGALTLIAVCSFLCGTILTWLRCRNEVESVRRIAEDTLRENDQLHDTIANLRRQ